MRLIRHAAMASVLASLLLASASACADDWYATVHACVARHDLDCARSAVEARLAQSPHDLDALIWRARLLAWSRQWPEAEDQYQAVLAAAPTNADALLGLADVQWWSGQSQASLNTLDRVERAHAPAAEILSRRARILASLHRNREAMRAYRELLSIDPGNASAQEQLETLRPAASRHFLTIGSDTDTFNYTGAANLETISLESRWNHRWTTIAATNLYQRFGETAESGAASVMYHLRPHDWITAGGDLANRQDVVAQYALRFGYGHGWDLSNRLFRGLEVDLRHDQMWFTNSRVATFGSSETLYFPHDWMLTVETGAVRTRFSDSRIAWAPSGFARLAFPIVRRLDGNILYGVGAENFPTADQTGRFSAHTYGGGLKLRLTEMQEISGTVAAQERTQHRSQFSIGIGYGIRF